MPPVVKRLTAYQVTNAKPGRYGDGDGLYLLVRKGPKADVPDRAFWLFRYTPAGRKMREVGLGRARGPNAVTLAEARDRAGELHRAVRAGRDPLDDREAAEKVRQAEERAAAKRATTFRDVAEDYVAAHRGSWRNPKHGAQWTATLETYVYPLLGDLPVGEVDTDRVLAVLTPIWSSKPETASRVRGRIEAVLAAAAVKGLRSRENPASWRGHLSELLPARSKVAPVQHHAAMPFADLPAFFLRVQATDGLSARALELTILTAARSGEVLGARWSEFDIDGALWIVPADRMKARREHRVPLSAQALSLLRKLDAIKQGAFVFTGQHDDKTLSVMAMAMVLRRLKRTDITVHGFRSTFRDWAAETTGTQNEVVEMALAHAVGDKVEAAYRRGDLFDKRKELMIAWGRFCASEVKGRTRRRATNG